MYTVENLDSWIVSEVIELFKSAKEIIFHNDTEYTIRNAKKDMSSKCQSKR